MSERDWTSLFRVDTESPVPPYEQLRTRVIEAVRDTDLAAGTRLPTVRKLAEELGLAANTVARAYRELESDDVIETRGRHGSFVATEGDVTHRKAQEAATAYASRMVDLGVDPEEALRIVAAAIRSR
jgi:DNA-binding transcriptional regulator YhcF (GntR family)